MGFFDFTAKLDHYAGKIHTADRLNRRHDFLIKDFKDDISGAKVLDLASHDGRWCYAFAAAGAASVHGVEIRKELIDLFPAYPDAALRNRVTLSHNDMFDELETLVARGETFDVIGVLGILYHIMDHHRLFVLLKALKPKLMIVDSDFMARNFPMVKLIKERTDNILNTAAHFEGQEYSMAGILSHNALEAIADTLGYTTTWSDWSRVPPDQRTGLEDYFTNDPRCRATCAIRPKP